MFILVVLGFLTLGSIIIWIVRRKRPIKLAVILFPCFFVCYLLSFAVRKPEPVQATILMLLFKGLFLTIGIYFVLFLLSYNDDDDNDDWRRDQDDNEPWPPTGPDPLWLDFERTRPTTKV